LPDRLLVDLAIRYVAMTVGAQDDQVVEGVSRTKEPKMPNELEPEVGLEPTTCALRVRCSTD
jgi:hypothetical protein